MKSLAIFASGSGTNAENIIRYFSNSEFFKVAIVLSNKQGAGVHERAKKLNVPSISFSREAFESGEAILDILKTYQIDFIVLAGFMSKIADNLLAAYPHKIVNIHPALLPKFGGKGMYGMHVHRAVIASGETKSGISIHYIDEHYDEGPIIFQAECPVLADDTPESLCERIHRLEHKWYPEIIEKVLTD
ncbi:MAG TPA: phosphoribosylglycinamide formyltransferase [Porphyromonadaceae bacterium]|nr:phosphoribosylglycinamide formyltransferase [Porphyromonadaceae bacterium]